MRIVKNKWFLLLGILFISTLIVFIPSKFVNRNKEEVSEISYMQFEDMVQNKKVESVNIDFSNSKFELIDTKGNKYKTDNPRNENFKEFLLKKGIEVKEVNNKPNEILSSMISTVLSLMLWVFVVFILLKKVTKTPISNNSNSEITTDTGVRFSDVIAGEPKEDIKNLVSFLKNPTKYKKAGASMPKGVIFYGPPGTGKTLLAKAISSEAKVPFFSVSGSDFVEMFAGVGAKRIRDLFKKAKENSPCIIFIDEIDSIGGKRGMANSHSEREQTINALLNELDGFNNASEILVLAATNRLDSLDDALIRSGRFDKHIAINLPELEERIKILELYARNKKISDDVNLKQIAKTTIGFSGSDLKNLLNEAAIIAVNNNRDIITNDDIEQAFFQIVMQGHASGKKRTKKEIEIIAWHEAGHAVVAKLLGKSVPKVTIIPSTTGAGGVTFITPEKMGLFTKEEIIEDVKICYAGRVAEHLLHKDENKITTGASSDIQKASKQIKRMISLYGMSDMGLLNLNEFNDSNSNKDIVLEEAQKISSEIYDKTKELLTDHIDILKKVANRLMEKEKIAEDELDELIGM